MDVYWLSKAKLDLQFAQPYYLNVLMVAVLANSHKHHLRSGTLFISRVEYSNTDQIQEPGSSFL